MVCIVYVVYVMRLCGVCLCNVSIWCVLFVCVCVCFLCVCVVCDESYVWGVFV